jgi:hypothetical protein
VQFCCGSPTPSYFACLHELCVSTSTCCVSHDNICCVSHDNMYFVLLNRKLDSWRDT